MGGRGGRMVGAGVAEKRGGRIRRPPNPRMSQSVEHGVALMRCFTAERHTLGIAELADMIGLSRSTTHRYACTLVALGYLEQDNKRRYRLTQVALRPGMSAIEALRAETPNARAILEELRDQTGHTVSMAALEGDRAIYIHRLHAHGTGQYEADLNHRAGAHVPVYCTAIGKALLASLSDPEQRERLAELVLKRRGPRTITRKTDLIAELTRIRAERLATCHGEQAAGVYSIAAAITHPGRSRPLAMSVTAPVKDSTVKEMTRRFARHVKDAAERI
jgi:IclR family transcriptional regulator, pca regulon regulatory protein